MNGFLRVVRVFPVCPWWGTGIRGKVCPAQCDSWGQWGGAGSVLCLPAALCPNSCLPTSGLHGLSSGMACMERKAEQSPLGTESAINIHHWNAVWNPICWFRYSRGRRGDLFELLAEVWSVHLVPLQMGPVLFLWVLCGTRGVDCALKLKKWAKCSFEHFILFQLLQVWAFSLWKAQGISGRIEEGIARKQCWAIK